MTTHELLTLVQQRLTDLNLPCAVLGKLPNTCVLGGTGMVSGPVQGFTGTTFRITVEEQDPSMRDPHPSPWLKAEVDAVTEVRCPNPVELAHTVHAIVRDRTVRYDASKELRLRLAKALEPK